MSEILLNACIFLEAIPEAVLLLKPNGFIALGNHRCADLFQQKYETFMNIQFRDLVSPTYAEKELAELKNILQIGTRLELPIHGIVAGKCIALTIEVLGTVPIQWDNQRLFFIRISKKDGIAKKFIDLKKILELKSQEMRTLQKINESLELMVKKRTQELIRLNIQLQKVNEQLQKEFIVRKNAEMATEIAYSELNQIFNTSIDGMCVINLGKKILRVNTTFCTLLNLKQNEIIGRNCFDIIHHPFCNDTSCPLKKVIKGEKILELELPIVRIDGSKIFCIVTATPLHTPEGKLIGIVEDLKDITERKKAEEEVIKAMQIKADFISMVSHELRTPLTSIHEGISIMLDRILGDLNAQQEKLLGIVKCNIDRLARLINEVLDLRKIESGRMIWNLRQNDINEAVKEAYESMLLMAQEKGLDLQLKMGENLPLSVFDKDKILQVLINLINNAIKFTEKGTIIIATSQEYNAIHVTVHDMGVGIREGDMSKLFQSFSQIGNANKKKVRGSGLGLSICKKFILYHKGKIWAESEYGRGSIFHFTLPNRR